ncbi:MAG: DUF3526 domain-containing protein, partial [Bacteroidota bacterium]|nr:DUF3526 domain-containing protein [Bacteroidota bacterium]MDE2645041.1 DUF3526 domain-containing protein [Bacteroidota bacterium]
MSKLGKRRKICARFSLDLIMNTTLIDSLRIELIHLNKDYAFWSLMLLLFVLMGFAAINSNNYQASKKIEVEKQIDLVAKFDGALVAQIDSLNRGLDSYANSYTLPTNGVRLTYNNHRITWLPFEPFSIIATGQSDIYSNYKKIILYFNESYEMNNTELVSPIEQLFGQLDLSFVWINILPLIIILTSFNILSKERETGRLSLIASQPISLPMWLLKKIALRFFTISACLIVFSAILLLAFQVAVFQNFTLFIQLALIIVFYSAFWFLLSFLVNLLKYSSDRSLIILTSFWALFVFLIPSIINQIGSELNPVSPRIEIINHLQKVYNEAEGNFDEKFEELYKIHPDWVSDDPVTKDISNPTGWNINYLAKQYIAQLEHKPVLEAYEQQIDNRNKWMQKVSIVSPAMIVQRSLTEIAGTSTQHYRSFLRQSRDYAQDYREYVFQKLFTNHKFTKDEIRELPEFIFDQSEIQPSFMLDSFILISYALALLLGCLLLINQKFKSREI